MLNLATRSLWGGLLFGLLAAGAWLAGHAVKPDLYFIVALVAFMLLSQVPHSSIFVRFPASRRERYVITGIAFCAYFVAGYVYWFLTMPLSK